MTQRLWTSRARSAFLMAVGAITVMRGCNCGGEGPGLAPVVYSCEEEGRPAPGETPCGASGRFVKGECMELRCDAGDLAPNCCPGMLCTGGGVCQPRSVVTCENDSECTTPGQRCLTRARVSSEKTCGFVPPDAAGACPEGQQLFNGRCIVDAPCEGECDDGMVCNIDTNNCEIAPKLPNADSGCDQSCGGAQMLVYADPDAMLFDQCCVVTCECATLPSLAPGPWGRFSDLVVTNDAVLVSGYDSAYGDLVLGSFNPLSNALTNVSYLDGVPSNGDVVANPAGPRDGTKEPGPDVGTYTSMVVHAGQPRIVYYDVDNQDLKLAAYDGTAWELSVIDDGGGEGFDVGRWPSLVVDDDGILHVTYYAHRVELSGLTTGLFYARAKNTSPQDADDWEKVVVDSLTDSCNGTCASTQTCVMHNGAPTCRTTRDDCSSCACDQACVDIGGPACRAELPNLLLQCDGACAAGEACVSDEAGGSECLAVSQDGCGVCGGNSVCVELSNGSFDCRLAGPSPTISGLSRGVGLFSSLALDGDVPTVVYYDQIRQHLRGAVAAFDVDGDIEDGFTALPLACGANDDVGQFASLTVHPGGLAVAYQALGGETLWMCAGEDLITCSANSVLVDDGARDARTNLVGAYASIGYDAGEDLYYIAYADQTDNDLLLAYGRGDTWKHTTLLSDGAYGGFAKLHVVSSTKAYVSNYLRRRDAADKDNSKIVINVVDLAALEPIVEP